MKPFIHLAVFLTAIAFTSAARGEQVDNPQYLSWAKHKTGTSVTMDNTTIASGMTMNQHIVQTLKQITPERATVEMAMTMDMGGQKHDRKQAHDIPAKVEKGQEKLPFDLKGSIKEVGEETVTIAGKSYTCKVVEFDGEGAMGKANGKIWRCMDIPGGGAKMEINSQGQPPATIKMIVTAIELK